jgi:hypothetical protein
MPRPKKDTKPAPKRTRKKADPVVQEPVQEEVYNHMRYQRCGEKKDSSQYPTFMQRNMTCNGLMVTQKTSDGGKYKHYKCPICGSTTKVEGELV